MLVSIMIPNAMEQAGADTVFKEIHECHSEIPMLALTSHDVETYSPCTPSLRMASKAALRRPAIGKFEHRRKVFLNFEVLVVLSCTTSAPISSLQIWLPRTLLLVSHSMMRTMRLRAKSFTLQLHLGAQPPWLPWVAFVTVLWSCQG